MKEWERARYKERKRKWRVCKWEIQKIREREREISRKEKKG